MRETHLLVLQKKEKLFLALSLAAVVLCTVLAFGFAVPLQAAESQVLPDTTGLEHWLHLLPVQTGHSASGNTESSVRAFPLRPAVCTAQRDQPMFRA